MQSLNCIHDHNSKAGNEDGDDEDENKVFTETQCVHAIQIESIKI